MKNKIYTNKEHEHDGMKVALAIIIMFLVLFLFLFVLINHSQNSRITELEQSCAKRVCEMKERIEIIDIEENNNYYSSCTGENIICFISDKNHTRYIKDYS